MARTPDFALGDVVAVKRGDHYDSSLAVVVSVRRNKVYVTFGGVSGGSFLRDTGLSATPVRREAGWRIVPFDAAAKRDVLAVGFAYGPCSAASMERMEITAKRLQREVKARVVFIPKRAENRPERRLPCS